MTVVYYFHKRSLDIKVLGSHCMLVNLRLSLNCFILDHIKATVFLCLEFPYSVIS